MPKPKSQRSSSSIILRKEGWIQLTNFAAIILSQGEPAGGFYVSFFYFVNIAGVNGQILFNKTHKPVDEAQNRRQFLKNLAMSLMKPHLQDRAQL